MKRRRVDAQLERQLLIGLITSPAFLGAASPVLDLNLLTGPFRQIAEWCSEFHKSYGTAPAKQIETIYLAWAGKQESDSEVAESVRTLLDGLSGEYERGSEINVSYLLDELATYLSGKKLTELKDRLEDSLLRGDVATALGDVQGFRSVQLGRDCGVDPLNELDAWDRAFADPLEPLLRFPGDAGQFLNWAMTRESFIGVQAPEKRGKTFWCLEFAYRALLDRRRVAFFGAGDLSQMQMMLRIGVRLSGLPMRWRTQDIEVPVKITGTLDAWEVEYKTKRVTNVLRADTAKEAVSKFVRGIGASRSTPYFMLACYPTASLTVRAIEAVLDGWQVERAFVPDVVIVDYADILAHEDKRLDARDRVNETWAALRRLSQERRCLVITPTQADARSYDVETQTMQNFSNDKRKMAHVTGMLGLNQNDSEKERGIMRLNWITLRENDYDKRRCLYVGQCLPLARAFCCGSLLRREIAQ